jgi:tRNA(adenine34) deaminase
MEFEVAESWMREAIAEALKGKAEDEVPVGAIVLLNGKMIGRGHNCPIRFRDPTAHAEIVALRQAAYNMSNYRLPGSTLIVTVEPCIMCVGAMIQARVEEVVYGAADPKTGAIRSCYQLAEQNQLNHKIRVTSGVLENECSSILKDFFANKR